MFRLIRTLIEHALLVAVALTLGVGFCAFLIWFVLSNAPQP